MNYIKKFALILLPIFMLVCLLGTNVSYADINLNITTNNKEAYTTSDINAEKIVNTIGNVAKNKIANGINNSSNKLKISDVFESNVDKDKKNSVVKVDDNKVPKSNTTHNNNADDIKESAMDDRINYNEEKYAEKIKQNRRYEIINKDLVVQNTTITTDNNKVKYITLPKGTEVKVLSITNPGLTRYVELLSDDGNIYYENVVSFYNNSIESSASPFDRYFKSIITDAKMLGSEKGYITCIAFAIVYLITTLVIIKFLDTSIFRLRNAEVVAHPYINSVARIMPGAMLGSIIVIANIFDANAVAYYFHKGFNILGKNYELIHWVLQIVILYSLFMVWRIILEGFRCFTMPCMIIRTTILVIANFASFYLCYALSYVGIAVYVLFVLYECVCVNSYGCADIGETVEEEEISDEVEESSEGVSEEEAEPEGA